MPAFKYLPPRMAEALRATTLTVRRPVHGPQKGLHRSPHFGSSVEFAEYRDYTPGDPTMLIDWNVYARTDRYVVRRYHEETNLLAYVLLDTSHSLSFRDQGPMPKQDYAAYLAAGLMYMLVGQGDYVSLMTFDDRIRRAFDPVGTSEGLRPLLTALEEAAPAGRSDIEQALHAAAGTIRSKSLVIVISDLLQESDRIVRGLRHLHHDGHNLIVVHVQDRGERRLSFGGVAELRDLETGGRVVVEVDEIRSAYEAAAARHADEIRRACADCLGEYRLADTSLPVEDVLNSFAAKCG